MKALFKAKRLSLAKKNETTNKSFFVNSTAIRSSIRRGQPDRLRFFFLIFHNHPQLFGRRLSMFKMSRSLLLFWIIFLLVVVSATLSLAMFDFIPGIETSGSRSDYSLPINSNNFNLDETCLNELRKQMNLEKRASLVYKQMAFHFGSIPVTRPGFAKLFETNYAEETEHFDKFIKYISLRGAHIGSFNISMPTKFKWDRALEAVEDAIELEHFVTNEIYRIHRIAEKSCKDIHLMDFLETEFITEQISSINKLMKLATLLKSVGDQGYGEYLIDRDLFEGKLKLEEL